MQGQAPTAPAPAAPKKPLWRRILRKVGWAMLGLVVLVALLVAFLHTSWGKDFVRKRAEKALAKRVTGTLSIGGLGYGFLFSDVELRDVRIDDSNGASAIELDKLYVDLDRGSLLDGAPILEDVVVEGVRVTIVKKADGTSNLTGLFVKSERKGSRITVGALRVADVNVRIERPDGSVTQISNLGVAGSATINSVDRQYTADLREDGAAVTIARADGTVIALPKAEMSIVATATATTAEVTLSPIAIDATLTRPAHGTQKVPIRLGATTITRDDGRIHADTGAITLGPLTIATVSADAHVKDKQLVGKQRVAIDGLKIAHRPLEALLGRPLLASDVAMNVSVEGPPEALVVDGLIDTDGGKLDIDGTADARDLKNLGYDVSVVGTNIVTAKIVAARGDAERPSLESSLRLSVRGHGIPRRPGSVADLELTTGPTQLSAKGKVGEFETLKVVAHAEGAAVQLKELTLDALGLKISASGSLSEGRMVEATVAVDGNARGALAKLRAMGIKPSRPLPISLPSKLDLDIKATGHLDGSISVDIAPTTIPIAGGSVRLRGTAELANQGGVRKLVSADAKVVLRRIRIEKAARIARRNTKLSGSLSGTATIRLRGSSRDIGFDVVADLDEPALSVDARGKLGGRGAVVVADVRSTQLGTQVATLEAKVPLMTRRGKRAINPRGPLELTVVVDERSVADLKKLVPARIAAKLDERATSGKLAATIKLTGTPAAPRGSISVKGRAELVKLPGQAVDIDLVAAVSPAGSGIAIAPKGTVSVVGIDDPIATIGGRATVGPLFRAGKLDKDGALAAATLGITVDVPERALASLAPLRPKLADLPGDVVVSVTTSGSPKAPAFAVRGGWSGYPTASGEDGAVTLDASGTLKDINATIAVGARGQVKLVAGVKRRADKMIVDIFADAARVPLTELLPKQATQHDVDVDYGALEWKMKGKVSLAKIDGAMKLDSIDLNGHLDVAGATVAIPNSGRSYRDVGLRIEADKDVVRLAKLSAAESDEQNKKRTIEISAETSLAGGAPKKATASIKANKWLVFGGSMGKTDAPRATLDADIAVVADLSGAIPVIDATIHALDFSERDRSARAHGLESPAGSGDIMFIDKTDIAVGKLGPVREAALPSTPRKKRPMLVHVHIPKPIHLEKTPLNIHVSGELDIDVKEDAVVPAGKLKVHRGKVLLFGHQHEYESGEIAFDEAHPKGLLSLTFARRLHPATLRELSRRSGGDSVKITIEGDVAKRKITLSGAGNAGMLEVMSAHQAGRAYYYTEPDLPASSSVQAPQLLQPLVLTFLATNLPHMLVLDRFSAWSDPYDSRDSYGRVEHFVGEHNRKSGKARVRVVARPRTLGRSATEVQLDRYLINTASMAIGAGIRAGSRLGGGLALFFEWTSSD